MEFNNRLIAQTIVAAFSKTLQRYSRLVLVLVGIVIDYGVWKCESAAETLLAIFSSYFPSIIHCEHSI